MRFDFLRHIDDALPDLRAGAVLDLIKKDPLAPTKTEDGSWGYQVYKTMFKGENNDVIKTMQRSGELNTIERDYVVFDDEHREEHLKLHDLYSPPITSIVWSACRGSTPNYRGYTCGLWMLFHTVLSNSPHAQAPKALRALHDYILHFFMCLECRVHFSQFRFQEFYDDTAEGENQEQQQKPTNHHIRKKKTDKDAVMWLFHVHNAVNRRLALTPEQIENISAGKKSSSTSTSSTDPLVPKVQFPPQDLCIGGCSSTAPEDILFLFLKNHYNWNKISRSVSFCRREKLHNSKNWFDQLKDEGARQGLRDDHQFHMNFFFFMGVFVLIVVGVWIFVAVKMGYLSEMYRLLMNKTGGKFVPSSSRKMDRSV